MVRPWTLRLTRAVLAAGLVLACSHEEAENDGLVLRGFQLVDVETQTLRSADVVIEGGRVSAIEPSRATGVPDGRDYITVAGQGRWLLPAFWDLKASLWGNPSTKFYRELFHTLWITDSLRVQLYYGVSHVVASNMARVWVERELKRAKALELDAAELLYPDLPLCKAKDPEDCVDVDVGGVPALLDGMKQKGLRLVQVYFGDTGADSIQPVSVEVLAAALQGAEQRGLGTYVFVDTWEQAQRAVELGANALQGLPQGELSESLIASLLQKGVAYAPALSGWLELTRFLGHPDVIQDPFLRDMVPPIVLDSYRDPAGLWEGYKPLLKGPERQERALADVRRLAKAGVHLLTASDAGWAAGAFQGYAVHAHQAWLERAGVDAWVRLRALSTWPAELMGRRAGFRVGDPADFVAVSADPLSGAGALREITLLVREGHVVDRAALKPDITRPEWRR
jgi:imidazolonepropionase-like amidohydrolase